MSTCISLLRGINVGGHKKIKMAELKSLYESLGFSNIQTLLQSGNVVFESKLDDLNLIANRIEAAIEDHFGFQSKIIMRTPTQFKAIVDDHPFSPEQLAEPRKIAVTFLQSTPDAQAVEALLEAHTGPESIYHTGQELYLFYPKGMGRSKLNNNFIGSRLKIMGTGRNWNTVNKILNLAEEQK